MSTSSSLSASTCPTATSSAPAWIISNSPALMRHVDFGSFDAWRKGEGRRLVLFTTKGAVPYTQFAFAPDDILLFGRESAGVPDDVHSHADARVVIPLVAGRSLNLAVSAAMAIGEAVRQVG
jgi:tRNA (cytidine/uridine-2'-O-)-methyltransferase